jgi:3-methyladenine DNA glycosylase AlkD
MCSKWFLKHIVVRKAETRKRGIKRKQLLDDLRNRRRYWNLKKEALNCTLERTGFGRG